MARWILIAAGLLVVLLGCGIGFRVQDAFRLTAHRRRRARWDAEWRETAPRWTRGEG